MQNPHSAFQLVTAIVLSAALSIAEAASLNFVPNSKTVNPGDTFTLDLKAFDLPAVTLGGSVDMFYAPSILRLDSVLVDSTVWEFDSRSGTIDNTNGKLDLLSFTSFNGQTGNVDIATLTFKAIGSGTTSLVLTGNPSNPFTLEDGNVFSPSLVSGTVTVSEVPVPAAFGLLVSGLLAMLVPVHRTWHT